MTPRPEIPQSEPLFRRSSGVLLHPTCLPGPWGIGDLGAAAHRFVDWLADHGQGIWQILPLGPTSYGDSPYQTLSAFAGNPLLIDPDELVRLGWLKGDDLADRPDFPSDRVDFGAVIDCKGRLLDLAYGRFREQGDAGLRSRFATWCDGQAAWLEDWVLFATIKDARAGSPWTEWPAELRDRQADGLSAFAAEHPAELESQRWRQWIFHRQWSALRARAAERGVRFFGDLPIFVAGDSCDVWAHREYFQLDDAGRPRVVSGVPPDYFSKTGQLWGNPLYDWYALRADGYSWWLDRLRACLELVDGVRIDHFRGFEAYWEVAAGAETAEKGRWVDGPGADFFEVLREKLGRLPIIAEDLGVITRGVIELRDRFDLPGMKVLQFAWSGPDNLFLPHHHPENCVVYSGTHDNDPTLGWWKHETGGDTRRFLHEYLGYGVDEPHWTLIRLGMMSVAHTFIATMQDVLGLGREAQMNRPGEGTGNWDWRMPEAAFTDAAAKRLARLTRLFFRAPDQELKPPGERGVDAAVAE